MTLCRLREWDSEFFGCRIAEVVPTRLEEAELGAIEGWCVEQRIDGLYFLCDGDPATIARVEARGFGLKATRLGLRRPASSPLPSIGDEWRVRSIRPDDLPALESLAAASHHDTRFYADPRFGRDRADELYRVWLRKSASGWAEDALALTRRDDDVPLGYITGHRRAAAGEIGLVAVGEQARGRGGGTAMLAELCRRHAAAGLPAVTVITSAGNLSAQRLYQRGGFISDSFGLWYHRWWTP